MKLLSIAMSLLFISSNADASVFLNEARLQYSLSYGNPNITCRCLEYAVPNPFLIQDGLSSTLHYGTNGRIELIFSRTQTTDIFEFVIDGPVSFTDAPWNGPVLYLRKGNPFGSLVNSQGIDQSRLYLTKSVLGINWHAMNFLQPTNSVIITLNAVVSGVPEPASWAMMIAGFGMVGGAMRRKSYSFSA